MILHLIVWLGLAFGLPFVGPFVTYSIAAIWLGLASLATGFYLWLYGDKLFGNNNVERMEREEAFIEWAAETLAKMQPRRLG